MPLESADDWEALRISDTVAYGGKLKAFMDAFIDERVLFHNNNDKLLIETLPNDRLPDRLKVSPK
jgi:hypothetical protein